MGNLAWATDSTPSASPHASPRPGPLQPSDAVTIALAMSSALSVLGCLFVIGTYMCLRRLRRHPASLVVVRSVVDLLFCGEILASHVYLERESNPVDDDCRVYSVLTQFLAIAAELYSLVQAADLLISTSNPFTNFQKNTRYYHVVVLAVSTATAIAVLLLRDDGHAVFGRDAFLGGICWLRRSSDDLSPSEKAVGLAGLGKYLWLLFVIPLIVIYAVSTAALLIARRRLARGLPETFEARITVFKTSSRIVLCYVLYWVAAIGVYWGMAVALKGQATVELSLVLAFALGSRGIVTCGVWLLTYGSELVPVQCSRKARSLGHAHHEEEGLDLRPHLNNALRKEILYYATLGIAKSVIRALRSPDTDCLHAGAPRVAFNRIQLSRRHEVTGLSDLEHLKEVQEAAQSKAATAAAASAAAARATALTQPLLPMGASCEGAGADAAGAEASAVRRRRSEAGTSPLLRLHPVDSDDALDSRVARQGAAATLGERSPLVAQQQFGALQGAAAATAGGGGVGLFASPPAAPSARGGGSAGAAASINRADAGALGASGAGKSARGEEEDDEDEGWEELRASDRGETEDAILETEAGRPSMAEPEEEWGEEGEDGGGRWGADAASGGGAFFARSSRRAPLLLRGGRSRRRRRGTLLSAVARFLCWGGRDADAALPRAASGAGPVDADPHMATGAWWWCGLRGVLLPSASQFMLHDYEPHLFARLRALRGIGAGEYVQALSRTRREKFSEGASGAFLYFSLCERFIVKTLSRAEADVLLGMLHSYEAYLRSNPHSLITRFLGCHAITMYGTTLYFCVMSNVLITHGAAIHERYDLKGSWVDRHTHSLAAGAKTECRHCGQMFRVGTRSEQNQCPARPNMPHKANSVLRDADWVYKLRLGADVSREVQDAIARDTEFLRAHHIMDYSLLLGIHRSKYRLVEAGAPPPSTHLGPATGATSAGDASPPGFPDPSSVGLPTGRSVGSVSPLSLPSVRSTGGMGGFPPPPPPPPPLPSSLPPLSPVLEPGATPLLLPLGVAGGAVGLDVMGAERGMGLRVRSVPDSLGSLGGSGAAWRHPQQRAELSPQLLPRHHVVPMSPVPSVAIPGVLARTPSNAWGIKWAPSDVLGTPHPSHRGFGAGGGTDNTADAAAGVGDGASVTSSWAAPEALSRGATGATITVTAVDEDDDDGRYMDDEEAGGQTPAATAVVVQGGPRLPFHTTYRGGLRATVIEGPGIYYMGIIDILQTWTLAKRLESFLKTRVLCRSHAGVSAIPPDAYAERFKRRVIRQLIEGSA